MIVSHNPTFTCPDELESMQTHPEVSRKMHTEKRTLIYTNATADIQRHASIIGPVTKEKTMQILVRGRLVTISTDRVKPAYMLNETGRGTTTKTTKTFKPAADTTPTAAPHAVPPPSVARNTRSGRHVHFPAPFNS